MQYNDYSILKLLTGVTALSLLLSPAAIVSAADYDQWPDDLPYTDRADIDVQTSAGLGILTDLRVFQGNDDGTFRPDSALNRAEFVTIILRLLNDDQTMPAVRCFPDVPEGAWYTEDVCRAKELGMVRGNAEVGVPMSQWRFEPTRSTLYAEAVKMLVELYAFPPQGDVEGDDWFVPYLNAANQRGLGLAGIRPGEVITRAEMAQLAARFYAHSKGELDLLLKAELRDADDQSSSSTSRSSSSRSSTSSVSSSVGSVIMDPLDRLSVRSRFLVAGETSPIVAAGTVFLEQEALDIDAIVIKLDTATAEVEGFLVYDDDGRQLGRASHDLSRGSGVYTLRLQTDALRIAKAKEFKFYVRGILRSIDRGAQSGVPVQVESLSVEGRGASSNSTYTRTTTETFPIHLTSYATLTIENAGTAEDNLVPGDGQEIGAFRFSAHTQDSQTDTQVHDIIFSFDHTSNVQLSNVKLRSPVTSAEMTCTVTSTTVRCENIPASLGMFGDDTHTLRLYGDVSVTTGNDATLRLSINDPGSMTTPGAVTWTDGETTFEWLPTEQPVVRGTAYSF
jgi:hypothetical protein